MGAIMIVLLVILVICLAVYLLLNHKTPPIKHTWLVAPDDELFKDNDRLIKDNQFVERVARIIEQRTGCQTAPDRDLIRVYRNNKLAGIVRCCEIGRNASPAVVREVVELADHLKVKTKYLATAGPIPGDTRTFATLQKVKLISL